MPDECTLTVRPGDTVLDVKRNFEEKIPLLQQQLTFNSLVLDNDQTLDSYNIQQDSRLHLFKVLSGDLIVSIETPFDSFPLNAKANETVEAIKLKIQDRTAIDPMKQILFVDNVELEHAATLCDYLETIQDKKINLNFLLTIFVKTATEAIPLEVLQTDTIADVVSKIPTHHFKEEPKL